MKTILLKLSLVCLALILPNLNAEQPQQFQGKAYYFSKSKMDLGRWGARLSEAQKKQIEARMKNRLEKTYVLTFDKEASFFEEEEKLDAMSGATDSWGKNFSAGDQYKNVKNNTQIQNQEFYGKLFLVKDSLQPIEWKLGSETKQIGNYTCYKAMATIPTDDLTWYSFSWAKLRRQQGETGENEEGQSSEEDSNGVAMTLVEAWYSPQIPVRHGPLEYWGLPGLILEVSADDTTMLCSKIVLNPEETVEITPPKRGTEITKKAYQATIIEKMKEFRNNRMRRRRG